MVAVDTNGLARTLMSMFIRIILKHGYLHCDPHAGNISVTPEGQIILYDYGLVTRFSRDFQDTFRQILFAFFDQNTVEVMELILKNRILYATESKATSVEQITDNEYVVFYKLVEYIFDYTRTLDITTLTQNITTDDYIDVNHIPLVFDSKMVLLFKTMTTLEGICKQLDPNFNYNRIILSMVTEVVDTTFLMDRAMTDIDDIMKTTRIKEFVDFIRTNFESPYTSESTTANGTASRTASGNVNGEWNTDQVMMTTTDLLRQAMRRRPGGNPMGVQIDKDRLLNARLGKMEKRMESERTMGAIGVGLVALINMLFTN
jgi:predicted unusual protein kinase regulating ubiquinone biosynthesis (AarF/ABC1/UbiB family)